ncbi:uncharacterized protein LOC128202411 [Galleria mellonella]|uniref:Uncharacterized protein LOC128202411 n=1 Tax=Galleria mellonella TaxID=7137 RepID=A0ABM3N4V6_GALME|nr:uncharacterized protein LOC128202411 [Galleria mellonella]
MESVQQSLEQLMAHFDTRMAAFQSNLDKASTAPVTLSTLSSDFAQFKTLMTESLISLQQQVHVLAQQQDRLEMHNRRKILLLHGVRVDDEGDLTTVVSGILTERLKVPVSPDNISRTHRMGGLSQGKLRPILVKFRRTEVRNSVWSAKTALKNSGITLSEFLTKTRHDIFMKARKHFGVTKCWTRNGVVVIIGPDGKRHRVSSIAEVSQLINVLPISAGGVVSISTNTSVALKTSDSAGAGSSRSKRVVKK